MVPPDDKPPRRGSMSDAERALAGADRRGRSPGNRTPAHGVVVRGELEAAGRGIDAADTLDDRDEFGGPTPLEHVIEAAQVRTGAPLSAEVRAVAEALYEHSQNQSKREANQLLEVAAQHPPSAVVATEVRSLRARMHVNERVAGDSFAAHATHASMHRAELARVEAIVDKQGELLVEHERHRVDLVGLSGKDGQLGEVRKTSTGLRAILVALAFAALGSVGLAAKALHESGSESGAESQRINALEAQAATRDAALAALRATLDSLNAIVWRRALTPPAAPAPDGGHP